MLLGQSILNGVAHEGTGAAFQGFDPAAGTHLDPVYRSASADDVDLAARLADDAFGDLQQDFPARRRRSFCATLQRALRPSRRSWWSGRTAKPRCPRRGCRERWARTVNQLRLFAQVVEEGSWAMARIDPAQPERKPLAARRHPLCAAAHRPGCGVWFQQFSVGVFRCRRGHSLSSRGGESGDRQGAFGASRHERDGGAGDLRSSVRECGLPAGTFALIFGSGAVVGSALVEHPSVKAVGFTGSLHAGKALMQLAAARPEPIPCYMEMSSTNPLFVLPEALRTRAAQIAEGPVWLVHSGRGSVLHQARVGLPAS